jgi:exodeoxyribonuclease V beta subunit
VESLDGARRSRALDLRVRFALAARQEARIRREEKHVLFFDDLLSEMRAALRPPNGDRLVELLRNRYRFALIDEFQDTDPVQYEIFRRVWHFDKRDPARGGLVLIGDPKQAIYSFRGADVFTYLVARLDAKNEAYNLAVNWRSNAGLIAALNALFGRPRQAFGLDSIEFNPVAPRPDAERALSIRDRSGSGLRVLMADRNDADKKELPLRFGRTDLMRAFANDVANLLEAGVMIGERPLRPSDIAVLCRRKSELTRARRALEAIGIPCVDRGDSDVFESREAWELASVLRAMLRSGDPALLRGALSTGAHGLDATAIAALGDESEALSEIGERYAEYARIWTQSGFGLAFATWRRREGVAPRLLGFEDGERRLTNWLHLAELLQRIEMERTPSRMGLIAWLERAIATPEVRSEVGAEGSLLRLERDDQAVSLVTLHRSKGLEYEVVYLPSLWEDAVSRGPSAESAQDEKKSRPPVRFYDETTGKRTLDLGGPDQAEYAKHVERSVQEERSEQLRLLYVGLTRAKKQCVVLWGAIGTAYAKTPLAWLLHARQWQADNQEPSTSAAALRKWKDEEWVAAWQAVADEAGADAVSIEHADFAQRERWHPNQPELRALDFQPVTRRFGRPVSTTSFSALTRDGHRLIEPLSGPLVSGRDRDGYVSHEDLETTDRVPDLAASMHEFPRGPEAGTLLHDVLERVDFTAYDEDEARVLATEAIERTRFEPVHVDRIVHVVESVAHTPLRSDPKPFCLADVAQGQQRAEIEFTLSARRQGEGESFSPSVLAGLLATEPSGTPLHHYAERLARMSWRELNGYLRGFIDSVFCDGERYFLIDYKSNDLGRAQVDYRPERLLRPMIEHDYILQYLIYTIALDRHLKEKLLDYDYDVHFGGVYYLFLRGLARAHEPDCGIYFDRPGAELIRRVSELLGDGRAMKGAA